MQLCTRWQTSVFDACDDHVRDQMEQLEWKYGPDVLSSSYNKVGRLVQHCQKVVSVGQGIDLDQALSFFVANDGLCCKHRESSFSQVCHHGCGGQATRWLTGMVWDGLEQVKVYAAFDKMLLGPLKKENEALWETLNTDVMPLFSDPPKGHPAGCRGLCWRNHGEAYPSGTTSVRPTPNALLW